MLPGDSGNEGEQSRWPATGVTFVVVLTWERLKQGDRNC